MDARLAGRKGATRVRRGFVLGKFMPPHAGHVALWRTAAALVDELTILVCTRDCEPIPGHLRVAWTRALMPEARIVHLDRDVPQEPGDHPDFWAIWRGLCREAHPEKVDLVFGSEAYVVRLAAKMGADPVVVDPGRDAFAVSGSAIRADPAAHWRFVPGPVRPYYQRRVCLVGPESTGKSTLARLLARQLGTLAVPEYGRSHSDHRGGGPWTEGDFAAIRDRQNALRAATAQEAGPVLIEDTDALLTSAWQAMMLGDPPGWEADVPLADLYLLAMPDVPWVDDGTRFHASQAERERFLALTEAVLARRRARVVRLAGDWHERARAAVVAIEALQAEHSR